MTLIPWDRARRRLGTGIRDARRLSVQRSSAKHAKCGFKAKRIVFKIKGCHASFVSWILFEVASALSLSLP